MSIRNTSCEVIDGNGGITDPFQNLAVPTNTTKQQSSGLQKSIHGILFQLKLLMLFLCRAVNKGYSFRLTTEWDAAEKFDDLVFAYESADKTIVYRFLQAKHKQSTDSRNFITERNLFHEKDGDFDVAKYFISYRKIKQNPLFVADNVELKDFIISTNTDIDAGIEYLFNELTEEDEILDTQGYTSRRLKFNDAAKEKFKVTLYKCSDVGQLAKKLSECILKNKRIDFQDELFKAYHDFLVHNVINVEACKFADSLFDSEELSLVRNLLLGYLQIPNNLDVINDPTVIENIKKLMGFVEIEKCSSGNFKFSSAYLHKTLSKVFASGLDETQIKLIIKSKLQIRKEFKSAKLNCNPSNIALLLENSVTDEEIDDFLNRLVFAVGQPNETNLTEVISIELDKNFNITTLNDEFSYNKLLTDMLDWLKNKKDNFLSHADGNDFLTHIKQSLDSVKLQILTAQNEDHINTCNLQFRPQDLDQICFNIKEVDVLSILNPCNVTFTSSKIFQIVKNTDIFGIAGTHVYLRSKQFADLQLCVESVLHKGKIDLLIIEFDSDDIFELYEIHKWIIKMLTFKIRSKIILISMNTQEFPKKLIDQLSSNNRYIQIEDSRNSFENITPQSQDLLLRSIILNFYGQSIPLTKLVPVDIFKAIISNTKLTEFYGKEITIGLPYKVKPSECYYIPQNCNRSVFISDKIKNDTNNFCIAYNEDIIMNCHKDIIFISNNEVVYTKLCEKYCDNNIHWLTEETNGFKWQKTHGRIDKIRSYLTQSFMFDYKVDTVFDIKDKLVIISGIAGMGKSSLLSHVLYNIKTSAVDKISWVEKINLIDHSTTLKSMKVGHIDEDLVLKFLHQAFNIHDDSSSIARAIFNYYYSINKITLFLDGFDEISPNYKSQVVSILNIVKNKVKRLWITTRPYDFQRELEDELSTIPYVLQPFNSLQVQKFLKLYWSKSISDIKHGQFCAFVNEIFAQFSRRTDDYQGNFMKIPLQTCMIGQVFKELFITFQSAEHTSVPSDILNQIKYKLNLVTFYGEFIKMKIQKKTYDINKDKPHLSIIYKSAEKAFMNLYMELSLCELFSYENLEKLFKINVKKFYVVIEKFTDSEEKFGIIDRVVDGIPRFIHRTIAEYFTALWFCENFQADNVKQFLRYNIFNQEFNIINQFMNNILCMDFKNSNKYCNPKIDGTHILHKLVLNNDSEQLLKCDLNNICDCLTHKDKGGRTIFHLVAFCATQSTTDALLEIITCHTETSVNLKDDFLEMSALSYAIGFQKWGRCEYLLKVGANTSEMNEYIKKLSTEDDKGQINNLLFLTIRKGYTELLKLITVNSKFIQKSHRILMIHCAIKYERFNIVKHLVAIFENIINNSDELGNTALHVAAESGNPEIFAWLLHNGASLNNVTKSGIDVLNCALECHKTKIVKYIYDTSVHNIDSKGSDTILMSAIRWGNVELMNYLISKGININIIIANGRTLLHEAVRKCDLQITKSLVEGGIALNWTDDRNFTALHCAVELDNGHPLYLIREKNAMYHNAWAARVNILKYLIDSGIDVNIADENGCTALHMAAQWNNESSAIYLIDAGSNLKALSNNGDLAFHNCLEHYNLKIAKYFVEQKGFDINIKNKCGQTGLHHVAKLGITRSAVFLISHDIDISIEDVNGRTALYFAITHDNVNMAKYLINSGHRSVKYIRVDLVVPNYSSCSSKNFNIGRINGRTALHIAAQYDKLKIAQYIIESGYNINSVDSDGFSALDIAVQHGNIEFANFLISEGADANLIYKNGHDLTWHAVASSGINIMQYTQNNAIDTRNINKCSIC